MSIPAVVTGGFGNGVFSPGVEFVPTLGFSIGEFTATTPHAGIACFANETITRPGFSSETLTRPGFSSETITRPGFANETFTGC